MSDLNERVAVLESRLNTVTATIEQHGKLLVSIDGRLDSIESRLIGQKGFIGGVMFIASCLGTFLAFGKDWFLAHWK